MQPFEKLKDRLNDALEKIEISLETELENRENDDSLESLISENEGLKHQIFSLKAELTNLKEEREEEKKELQSLYNQLSAALAASEETV